MKISTPLLPNSQSPAATLAFGQIEYQPASGNQDEEFIEIQNPGATAIDLSGWTLEGGVSHTFQAGTVIAAGQSLYLSPDSATFRNRGTSPTGGESLFVQGNYSGHLSNLGELLTIRDEQGSEIVSTMTPSDPSDLQLYLVISEVMYHPQFDNNAEFIELMNISDDTTLDLAGASFTEGVEYLFPAGTSLAPGERMLATYADFGNLTRLSNGGETIKLEGPAGETIREFRYDDENGWPLAADGAGASLVLLNPVSNPNHKLAQNWRASSGFGGNPGSDDRVIFTGTISDDLDGDGYNALLEHFFGTSDQSADPNQVTLTREGNFVSLKFQRLLAAEDISFVIQSSNNLDDWGDVNDAVQSCGPYDGSGRQEEIWTIPSSSEIRQFFRIKVSRLP